jgi:hypothetical protein
MRKSFPLPSVVGAILAALLPLTQGVAEAADHPLFDVLHAYPVGTEPSDLAVGDLNRDGKADLITANQRDSTVSVLMGNGDGTFQSRTDSATGPTGFIAIGDVNGDSRPDMVCTRTGGVSVLLGNGDGTFQARTDYPVATGFLALGDLNRDGRQDVVVTHSSGVSVLLARADGTLAPSVDYVAPAALVAIADMNGDLKPDLVTANGDWASFLPGNGDGTFGTRVDSPRRPAGSPAAQAPATSQARRSAKIWGGAGYLAAGDLNGDGATDIAITNGVTPNFSFVSVLLGNRDGSFQAEVSYSVPDFSTCVRMADVTGDGKLDLVTSSDWSACVSVLAGRGDGTVSAAMNYGATGWPRSVVVGDWNGDGKPDIASANTNSNTVSILLAGPGGAFFGRQVYPVGRQPLDVAVGDLDGDGRLDAVAGNWDEPTVSVLFGNGDGTLSDRHDVASNGAKSVAVADLNHDGKADMAAGSDFGPVISVNLSLGNRTFSPRVDYATAGSISNLEMRDMNGDGNPDLVATNGGGVSVLPGNGDGTFGTRGDYAAGLQAIGLAIADLNGDGKQDIILSSPNLNTVSVLVGAGDGTFPTHVEYAGGSHPGSLVARDLDGDGKADLVARNSDGTVSVFLGRGDGTLQGKADYAVPGTGAFAVDDFDGDGKLDILATGGGSTTFLSGNGDGTFAAPQSFITGIGSLSVVTGDFDRDGRPDVAATSPGNTLSIFRNRSLNVPTLATRVFLDSGNLDLHDHARWLTVYLEPVGFDPAGIDLSSLRLDGPVPPAPKVAKVADRDRNGKPEVMVKFDRAPLDPLLTLGMNRLEVTGSLLNGGRFAGSVDVRVIDSRGNPTSVSVSPNPVNPEGSLSFRVGSPGRVTIRVFDTAGRLMSTVLDAPAVPAGSHHVAIQAAGRMASGLYFYRVETPEGVATGRFTVLK